MSIYNYCYFIHDKNFQNLEINRNLNFSMHHNFETQISNFNYYLLVNYLMDYQF